METFNYTTTSRTILADLYTPVSIYMRLRDLYPQSALMESSDYHDQSNARSFIGINPVASVAIGHGIATVSYPDGSQQRQELSAAFSTADAIHALTDRLHVEGDDANLVGLFGYTSFNAVRYFENIAVKDETQAENDAPDVLYILYKTVIVFDHHNNRLKIVALEAPPSAPEGMAPPSAPEGATIDHALDPALETIEAPSGAVGGALGASGAVGGALRMYIDPIAGTTRRTGDAEADRRGAEFLRQDPKENAEHVMLVDLARNDLSRNCHGVKVEYYKDIQYYSHVIHLVSRVSGMLDEDKDPIQAFIDTFPAGTLSGAPKVRAMQLISEYEPHNRGAYGGCIGVIGLDGSLNQAITIRTFVSRGGELWFQAGGGIVAKSDVEYELQEVNNKLGALRRAISMAEEL